MGYRGISYIYIYIGNGNFHEISVNCLNFMNLMEIQSGQMIATA